MFGHCDDADDGAAAPAGAGRAAPAAVVADAADAAALACGAAEVDDVVGDVDVGAPTAAAAFAAATTPTKFEEDAADAESVDEDGFDVSVLLVEAIVMRVRFFVCVCVCFQEPASVVVGRVCTAALLCGCR